MSHPQQLIDADLRDLLRRQEGVVSREQARAFLSSSSINRYLREQLWLPLAAGIYFAGITPGWRAWAWAGALAGGPSGVVGGSAALHLLGVLDDAPPTLLVFSPRRVRSHLGPVQFVRATRPGRGELPRELIDDALIDAWPELGRGDFLIALGRSCQRRLTTPARVRSALERHPTIRGRQELLALVAEGAAGIRSPLESDYRRLVERPHGLPAPERQARTAGGESDLRYRRWGVVVELDGRRGHELGRFRDMARDNRNTAQGLLTLRFGWADVHDQPCSVALQVAAALHSRGWPDMPTRCPRCRLAPGV